jgi:hypothetical protein
MGEEPLQARAPVRGAAFGFLAGLEARVGIPALAAKLGMKIPVLPQRGQLIVTVRLAPILPYPINTREIRALQLEEVRCLEESSLRRPKPSP